VRLARLDQLGMGVSLCSLATLTDIVQPLQGGSGDAREPCLNGSAILIGSANEPVDENTCLRWLSQAVVASAVVESVPALAEALTASQLASRSTRSFSGWPAWPFTHFQVIARLAMRASIRIQRS
jgi:hypothetical protein